MYDTIVYTYLLGTCQFLDLFEQEQEKDSLQRYYNLEKKRQKKRKNLKIENNFQSLALRTDSTQYT